MEYPEDIQIDETRDIFLDGANDIATIGGIGQLEQSVALDVMDELQDFVGSNLTGTDVGKIEARVRQSLDDDPQIADVRSVTIERYNKTTNALTMSVTTTANNDFTLELTA